MKKIFKKIKKAAANAKKTKGFTLTELLISIALVAVIGGFALMSLFGYRDVKTLDNAAEETIAILRSAQQNAMLQKNASQWGVRFTKQSEADYYELYRGTSYPGTIIEKRVYPSSVRLSGPDNEVNFSKITGKLSGAATAPVSKTIVLYLVSNPEVNRVINIDANVISSVEKNVARGAYIPKSIILYPGNMAEYTSIILNQANNPLIAYNDEPGDIRVVKCSDAECSIKEDNLIRSAGPLYSLSNNRLFFKKGRDDKARLVYDDYTSSLNHILCDSDNCVSNILTPNIDQVYEMYPSVTADVGNDDGNARISFKTVDGSFRYIRCLNDICSTKITNALLISESVINWPYMTLGSDNLARIAWSGVGGVLRFTKCNDIDCGTTTGYVTVDPSASMTPEDGIAIAIDSANHAHIIYRYVEGINLGLKYVHCTSDDCSNHTEPLIIDNNTIGNFSIAIGPDDYPYIAYHREVEGSTFMLVRCRDSACTRRYNYNIAGGEHPGERNSIVVGSDGIARISFVDQPNVDGANTLRYAYMVLPY